ncbi:thioredoxin family protein [Thermodesulfobacteriota bacterium]
MLAEQNLMEIQEVAKTISGTLTILLNKGFDADQFEQNLFNIARQVAGVTSETIGIAEGGESILPGMPSITLTTDNHVNIHYFAAPEGTEFEPFLSALKWLGKAEEPPGSATIGRLDELESPATVMVLMAGLCPHCPVVVRNILAMAVRQPLLTVTIVDAMQFPQMAERYRVKSTPTVIVNDGATLVGQVRNEDLVDHIVAPADSESLTRVLESMISSGRAEDAAELMIREKRPEAILPIYLSEEFAPRMGALLAMEEALEKDSKALDPIVVELSGLLTHEDVRLRGDTAELLGKAGNPAAIPALKKAAKDEDPDVREAAEEALEALRQ